MSLPLKIKIIVTRKFPGKNIQLQRILTIRQLPPDQSTHIFIRAKRRLSTSLLPIDKPPLPTIC